MSTTVWFFSTEWLYIRTAAATVKNRIQWRRLTVFVPRFWTRHLSTARSPGLAVMFRAVGRNTDRGGYTAAPPAVPSASAVILPLPPALLSSPAAAAAAAWDRSAPSTRVRRGDTGMLTWSTFVLAAPAATGLRCTCKLFIFYRVLLCVTFILVYGMSVALLVACYFQIIKTSSVFTVNHHHHHIYYTVTRKAQTHWNGYNKTVKQQRKV